jgi:hypothetical protein
MWVKEMNGKLTNHLILGLLITAMSSSSCLAAGWTGLRTSGSGSVGWQPLICANGGGWQSCELPVTVTLTASPPSLVANGQQSTITATVTDYYGAAVPNNVINWSKTDGSISATQATTNASGKASIILTSSWTIGGSAVTASTAENDGSNAIWVPFVDSFVAYPATYTGWANNGGVYSCSAWSPDASTVDSGTWFTQTASCYQNYYRYRQDRQQSVVTGAVTNVGGQVAEYTSSTVGVSQSAVGTRYVAPPTPPTPPTPPPAATTCSYGSPVSDIMNSFAFATYDPHGQHAVIGGIDDYDASIATETSNIHGTTVYPGYVDYNGYRYTSGRFMEYQSIYGVTHAYYFELCRTPL